MGPLAEGRRHRDHGRADAPRLDAGARAAAPAPTRSARAAGSPRTRWPSPAIDVAEWTLARTASARRARRRETASRPRRRSSTAARRPPAWTRAHGAPSAAPATSRSTSGAEDGRSLTFTSPPLERARSRSWASRWSTLEVAADRPDALLAVRLCDVAPDGSSTLVTRGLLNLTHRDGHERADAARAGPPLHASRSGSTPSASAIPAGHRAAARASRRRTGRSPGRRRSR